MAPVLLVGVTGGMGQPVLQGLAEGGLDAGSTAVLTRRVDSPAALALAQQGFALVQGDLDDAASLAAALQGVSAVYVHALSKDAAKADPAEVARARQLRDAMAGAGVAHVVYNSSAGRGAGAGISQMDQKHAVEDVFSSLPFTALQATLFMEELWKKYTRPKILEGTFAFAVPADKPLQLLAVKDMGRAAAAVLADPDRYIGQAIPLAGDALTPAQMCDAFSAAQGGQPVKYSRLPAWPFWLLNRDLYRICRFYSTTGYDADVARCRREFGLMSFPQFLAATNWGDGSLSFEGGVRYYGSPAGLSPR